MIASIKKSGSIQLCPHLRGHYVAIRCRAPRLYGVNGILHTEGAGGRPMRDPENPIGVVANGSPRRALVQAAQSVMLLEQYTVVSLPSGPLTLAT